MSEPTNPVAPVVVDHPAKTLRAGVEEVLSNSGSVVRERIKNHLVEQELQKRTDMLLQGLVKRDELERNLRKIRPDQVLYAADGGTQSEGYSKAKLDELKKAKDTLTQMDKALEEALADKPNFEKLNKAMKGGGNQQQPEKQDKGE